MNKLRIMMALATTVTLATGTVFAAAGDSPMPSSTPATPPMMEQCKILDKDGKGAIKPNMADSGPNMAGDANAWINVPAGQCAKINAGDVSGVSQDIKDKIDTTNMNMTTGTPSTTSSTTTPSTTTGTTMNQSKNTRSSNKNLTSKNTSTTNRTGS